MKIIKFSLYFLQQKRKNQFFKNLINLSSLSKKTGYWLKMNQNTKIIIISVLVISAAAVIISVFMNKPEVVLPEKAQNNLIKGITFENIGENSLFSSVKRKELEKKFGNDVLESWTPINFEDFPQDFLKEYLSDIFNISKELENPVLKEKSGKGSIKIKYPYAQKNTDIFKDIHLTFSAFTKKPLLFRISGYENENILKNLTEKFSEPEKINFQNNIYYLWKKDNSKMISQVRLDRFNKPYLFIVIYYVENIKNFFAETNTEKQKNIENIF